MGLTLCTLDVQLGRGKTGRQVIEHDTRIGHAAHNLQQAATGIGAIIKAIPALLEEDVATHLATQRRVDLTHLGLDQ